MDYQKELQNSHLSAMGQIGGAVIPYSKQPDLFDELREAQTEYANACHVFQTASINREKTAARLHDLSDKANRLIQTALQDPAVPQPDACNTNPRPNGRY